MSLWDRVNNPRYKPKPKSKAEVLHLEEFREEIAKKKKPQAKDWDDRIRCIQCTHLATNGACRNAKAAGAPGKYHPVADILRRCDGYEGGRL